MKVNDNPPLHLTYCLNVHPAESWEETFDAIRTHSLAIRDRLGAGGEFALGLRLSNQAACTLADENVLNEFADFLERENLYVFTINGFAYGEFHSRPVKQDVYKPDWRSESRLEYTMKLAHILSKLLPPNSFGSISTVPGSYREWIRTEADLKEIAIMLARSAIGLMEIYRDTGKEIILALEPEPDCLMEGADDAIRLLPRLAKMGANYIAETCGMPFHQAMRRWKRYIGLCLDTAHLSVNFEDPAGAITKVSQAGIRIGKVQISAALQVGMTTDALKRLADFAEPVYLHQVKALRTDGKIDSFPDLPAALAAACDKSDCWRQWRVHFHLPLFFKGNEDFTSTAKDLSNGNVKTGGRFAQVLTSGITQHLEIETYTYNVLPERIRGGNIVEDIVREYQWVIKELLGRIKSQQR